MKKYIFALSALVIAVMLSGCDTRSTLSATKDTEVLTTTVLTQGNQTQNNEQPLGSVSVNIKSIKLDKSYSGQNLVTVIYDFTNNGDEAASFAMSCYTYVYQNGIQLDSGSPKEYNNSSFKNIKKGVTLEVQQSFVLLDNIGPVDVEVVKLFSVSSNKIERTFELPKE